MNALIWLSLAAVLVGAGAPPSPHAQCLHGPDETPAQGQRRRDALRMTRFINTAQAQASSREGRYLDQAELANAPGVQKLIESRDALTDLTFEPGGELLSGWDLALERSANGYWFMIKDKTDPCGFAYISNRAGVIYRAEPIR